MAHAELASENITPHRLIKSALDEDGINELIQHVPGWSLREEEGIKQLTKSFKFKDFAQALRFTNRIGALAEKENHHPAILTEWGKVTIIWWTHSVKGLHRNDFIMAARCDSATSGISRNPDGSAFGTGASDFIVSLGQWTDSRGSTNEQAGTLMHELGHNLGLRHGGEDHTQWKPNYLSVMNYALQTRGLIENSRMGHFDYSRWDLSNLDENHLNETTGINLPGGLGMTLGTMWFCALDDLRADLDAVGLTEDFELLALDGAGDLERRREWGGLGDRLGGFVGLGLADGGRARHSS